MGWTEELVGRAFGIGKTIPALRPTVTQAKGVFSSAAS